MKKQFLFSFFLLITSTNIFSQNVGIGTTTPAFKLDVKGNINTDSVYHIAGNPVLSIKGLYNTFVGVNSGVSNTTGTYNTSYGNSAMWLNSTGTNNTVVGANALFVNTAGSYNTAMGTAALQKNTASDNTAIGAFSLTNNTSGGTNTAVGYRSLFSNTTGFYNTAMGYHSLDENTAGSSNAAVGYASLRLNTTGVYNVANGYQALYGNTNGEGNTGIGTGALNQNGSSSYNTAVGHEAGRTHLNGWNNTFIGSFSQASTPGLFNCIAIGNAAFIWGSNQVRIGNSSHTTIGGYVNWSTISDGRFKKNISEDVKGLDFIMKLRPVTYNLDVTSLRKKLNEPDKYLKESKMDLAIAENEKMIQTGFVAQEVEQAAKELGYDFSGVDKPKNENDLYGLRYAEFVVPLVKAVQEQQQQLNETKKEIELLKKQNKVLLQLLNNKK